jgi:hypothetical protein
MSFLTTAIIVLASMVLVLSGMVGYLYFQQTRVMQSLNGLASIVASRFIQPEVEDDDSESEDDDRVTVEKDATEPDVEVVELAEKKSSTEEPIDTDTLQDKSVSELKDMLTKKGIPFGKRDAKTVLIQLLKATA